MFYVDEHPDLTLSSKDITFSNNTPKAGEKITIKANIRNIGDGLAKNTTIYFYAGLPAEEGVLIGTTTIDSIPVKGFKKTSINWIAVNGVHSINVLISPYNSFFGKEL